MELTTHEGLMKVRELLKRFNILIYTGSQLDDIVMMEIELDDLYEAKQVDEKEFVSLKMVLRRAYREAGGE